MHRRKVVLGAILIVAMASASSCCKDDRCTEVTEQNKETVSRALDELYNKGNLQLADEFYAEEYVWHNVSGPDVHGSKGMEEHVGAVRQAFPDIHIAVEEMIAENDKVVTRWTITGTHKGDLTGIPPTDVQVRFTGILT
jgi:steroid delta-isomerase-like uncharacterized protein